MAEFYFDMEPRFKCGCKEKQKRETGDEYLAVIDW